ncbi:hypothetical protein DY000_02052752 [Brassica cretica]|uniref:Uncharacterized protein n=1 Tax=Brassica cretica TaxID=69181 RepID=A0ABQ7AGX4_BRACR|nr:hypothetical protein DY000_02052752 [Brassica cretica]
MGERMKRVEEKVGEFDLRLAASEDYVQEQIVAMVEEKVGEFDLRLAASEDYVQEQIVAMYAAREEDDNSQRPKKRPKRD